MMTVESVKTNGIESSSKPTVSKTDDKSDETNSGSQPDNRNGYAFGNSICIDEEIPKARVLIPRERIFVPAKKTTDQPLVKYEIDSDEEQSSFNTPGTKDQAQSKLLTDGFDIDMDDSGSEDLDLIPPAPVQQRCLCVSRNMCSIQ